MSEFKPDIFIHGLFPVALGFAGLMFFRFKCLVPGLTCWTIALGIFMVVAKAHGIDALGAIAAIDIIWTTIFCILWAFFAVVGAGVRITTRDLPRGDWSGGENSGGGKPRGGRRYTVSGDPNEPPPPSPESYRSSERQQSSSYSPDPRVRFGPPRPKFKRRPKRS